MGGEIGAGIRAHRIRLGLEAKDAARRAMVETPLYVRLEQGTARPTPWVLERIAQAMDVSVAELVTGCVEVERGPGNWGRAEDRDPKSTRLVTAAELEQVERMMHNAYSASTDYVNEVAAQLIQRIDQLDRRLDSLEQSRGDDGC